MTSPDINLDLELVGLPKTWIFQRPSGLPYASVAYLQRIADETNFDYIYLPAGTNLVEVTVTDMVASTLSVELWRAGGLSGNLSGDVVIQSPAQRVGTFTIDLAKSNEKWLKINSNKVSTNALDHGRVAVKIMNFPLATTRVY